MASQSETIDWESEHRRFEEVAYSRAVREADRHSRAGIEVRSKMWLLNVLAELLE